MNNELRAWYAAACCPPVESEYLDNFEASEQARWYPGKADNDKDE